MRDLVSNIGPAVSIAPDGNRTATVEGSGVDLRGFNSAAVLFQFAAVTDGTWTPAIEESDDNVSFTAATSDAVLGTLTAVTSASDETVQKAGYRGGKRYIRATITETVASTTGAKFAALVVKGHPASAPVA